MHSLGAGQDRSVRATSRLLRRSSAPLDRLAVEKRGFRGAYLRFLVVLGVALVASMSAHGGDLLHSLGREVGEVGWVRWGQDSRFRTRSCCHPFSNLEACVKDLFKRPSIEYEK